MIIVFMMAREVFDFILGYCLFLVFTFLNDDSLNYFLFLWKHESYRHTLNEDVFSITNFPVGIWNILELDPIVIDIKCTHFWSAYCITYNSEISID